MRLGDDQPAAGQVEQRLAEAPPEQPPIRLGEGRLRDLDLLLEIADNIGIIPGTTICGLADGAAWPIKNAIRKFRQEFEDFIRRTNPDGYNQTEAVLSLDPRRAPGSDAVEIAPWWPEAHHHG